MTPREKYNKAVAVPTSDMSAYMPYLRSIAKGNILELGVRDGESTSAFLLGLEENGGGHLYSVDIKDCGSLFADNPNWTFRHCSSHDLDAVIPLNTAMLEPAFDVLMIDGDHTPEGFRQDLHTYSQYVKNDGLIIVHDIDAYKHGSSMEKLNNPEFPSEKIRTEYFAFAELYKLSHQELPGGWAGMGVLWKR